MTKKIATLTFFVLGIGLLAVSAQTERSVKTISGGVVNGKAISLPAPAYPAAARAVGAAGAVNVQITIDEDGNVIEALAASGHPLLRQAAVEAARSAKFNPTSLSGQAVKVTGVVVYNFAGSGVNFESVDYWKNAGFLIGMYETKGGRNVSLPEQFATEEAQFETISKLPLLERPALIANNIAVLKSKLKPIELWRFEFGFAKGRIFANAENDISVFENLEKFKELSMTAPEGIQPIELDRAQMLGKFAGNANLSKQDKEAIFLFLK